MKGQVVGEMTTNDRMKKYVKLELEAWLVVLGKDSQFVQNIVLKSTHNFFQPIWDK